MPLFFVMPDITKCYGSGCPMKSECYRYTSTPSDYQSYFLKAPIEDGKCDLFWGTTSQSVYDQLKDIMK